MCYNPKCNCGGCGDFCEETPTWNSVEQAVNDVWSTKQGQITQLVERAEQAEENSEASATASAGSAAEAKDFRDQAETAAVTSVQALNTINEAAISIQDSVDAIEDIADHVETAIAGVAVRTWFYTVETEGQTQITIPDSMKVLSVQYIVIEGSRQDLGRGFEFDKLTGVVTLAEPLPKDIEVTLVLGTYNSDHPHDFTHTLASAGGAALVGAASGKTVQQELNEFNDPNVGDAKLAVKQPFTGSRQRTQHDKNSDVMSIMDFAGFAGDGSTNDTAAFTVLESNYTDYIINLAGRTYAVDAIPVLNSYINGWFYTKSLETNNLLKLPMGNHPGIISSTIDTGEYEKRYQNPLTGDYQPSGRSTRDLYLLLASQNSRSSGPARAVNIGSIYSYASGNVSGNYSARQCRATVPQSGNMVSEDCRVDGGFRGFNLASITSVVRGETGVNIGSRRGWVTGLHSVNIASVDAVAGGGKGATLKVTVSASGVVTAVTVVDAGSGYSANGVIQFYDRLSVPSIVATATYTLGANGAIASVTVTNGGAGYTTSAGDGTYEPVQAIVLDSGKYSANIATANNCVTYGEISFNLGANTCSAKANRSGNIAATNSRTEGIYAVNLGTDTSAALAERSVNIAAGSSNNSGIGSVVLGGGGNNIAVGADNSAIIAGNNSSTDKTATVVFGRRVMPRSLRTIVAGDAAAGNAATANIKWELVMGNGNVNQAGVLAQSQTFTDIAKMFENAVEGEEIPVGSLVTLEGRKVRLAVEGDDLLSSISATYVQLLGDSSLTWAGRYKRDKFGKLLIEKVWDEELGENVDAFIENEDFDPEQEQIPRSQRPTEWSPVAMVGEVHVKVDETVEVNSYVAAGSEPGLGTKGIGRTTLRCMEIREEFDTDLGYAIALCLVQI